MASCCSRKACRDLKLSSAVFPSSTALPSKEPPDEHACESVAAAACPRLAVLTGVRNRRRKFAQPTPSSASALQNLAPQLLPPVTAVNDSIRVARCVIDPTGIIGVAEDCAEEHNRITQRPRPERRSGGSMAAARR